MADMNQDCSHLEMINDVTPSSPDQCLQCVEMGDEWVHLRLCLDCGHVGCCDNSPNQHATKHAKGTKHLVIQTFEPEPTWLYCYQDDLLVDDPAVYFNGDHTTIES